jgi:TM2 domain-containing membrane protein YozV
MAEKTKDEIAEELRAEYRAAIKRTTDEEAEHRVILAGGKKSIRRAYVLWTFLGSFGVHRFYLGYPLTGAAMLTLTLIAGVSSTQPAIAILSWPVGIIVSVWWLADAFLIPKMIP